MRTPAKSPVDLSYANQRKGIYIESMIQEKSKLTFKDKAWVEHHSKTGAENRSKLSAPQFQSRGKFNKTLKQILTSEIYPDQLGSYMSIEAGFSIRPAKKYCDFHGFKAKYACPKTGLRFCSAHEPATGDLSRPQTVHQLQILPENVKNDYLSIRKANFILK